MTEGKVEQRLSFDTAYQQFIQSHQKARMGQPDRLQEGLGHAEVAFLRQVWWPAFENFEGLYPEYPTIDYGDHDRYVDFAYIRGSHKIAIEIDGLGPHVKDITQERFAGHLQRQNQLLIDGWRMLRFSYAQVENAPRKCQQTLQQLIGRLTNDVRRANLEMDLANRAILQFAIYQETICARDLVEHMGLSRASAFRRIQLLCAQGWMQPAGKGKRRGAYEIPVDRRTQL